MMRPACFLVLHHDVDDQKNNIISYFLQYLAKILCTKLTRVCTLSVIIVIMKKIEEAVVEVDEEAVEVVEEVVDVVVVEVRILHFAISCFLSFS